MPITKSAKKALRVSRRKRIMNISRKRSMNEAIKAIKKFLVTKKSDPAAAGSDFEPALSFAYQAIDKAAKRGVIKKNTAARKKARLARMVKK